MKLSNKILLGAFLFIVLLLTGVHAALRIKYNSGDIVELNTYMTPGEQQRYFNNINHVMVIGMNQCSVFLSDSVYVSATDKMFNVIECRVQGDTLYIDSKWHDKVKRHAQHGFYEAALYLPRGVTLSSLHSYINFWPGATVASDILQQVRLDHSGFSIHLSGNSRQAGKMALEAVQSSIHLAPGMYFDSMSVTLQDNSRFMDKRAAIQRLHLQMDSTSQVQLSGKNYNSMK